MAAGNSHMVAQRYGDALREFAAALRLLPDDAEASQAKSTAEQRLDDLQKQDRRLAEFGRAMDQGRMALRGRRYEQALRHFQEATTLQPNDPQSASAIRDARQKYGEAKVEFTRLMAQGDSSLQLGFWDAALRCYSDAAESLPESDIAARAVRLVQQRRGDLQGAQTTYVLLVAQATQAMRDLRYLDAVTAYNQALLLNPGDIEARHGLHEAKKAVDAEARRKTELDRLIAAGTAAQQQRKFPEAARAYRDALKLSPDNETARNGLSKANYGQFIADGQAAFLARRYKDAIVEFEAALKEMPGDRPATSWLAQARGLDATTKK